MHDYKHVYFKPWVGSSYGWKSKFHLPLLILGEAHYDWHPNGPSLQPELTNELIAHNADGSETFAFWTKICKLFEGDDVSQPTKRQFWDSVAFYNYIQESVGFGPRVSPTPQMWSAAQPAFLEMIAIHQPKCIIVLGKRLWDHLPLGRYCESESNAFRCGPTRPVNGRQSETRLYETSADHYALVAMTNHPSSVGFSSSSWRPIVGDAIECAFQV